MKKDHPYPCIGRTENRQKNTNAQCRCGEIGIARVHIQVNWFRGDDEIKWACTKHLRSFDFLLGGTG